MQKCIYVRIFNFKFINVTVKMYINVYAVDVILSDIIYCGFPNHIGYVVLIKSNL